jgi:hypothetical protein
MPLNSSRFLLSTSEIDARRATTLLVSFLSGMIGEFGINAVAERAQQRGKCFKRMFYVLVFVGCLLGNCVRYRVRLRISTILNLMDDSHVFFHTFFSTTPTEAN